MEGEPSAPPPPPPARSNESISTGEEELDHFFAPLEPPVAPSSTTIMTSSMQEQEPEAEQQQQQQQQRQLEIQQAINLRRRNLSRGTSVANFVNMDTIPPLNPASLNTATAAGLLGATDNANMETTAAQTNTSAMDHPPPPPPPNNTTEETPNFREMLRHHAREPSLADAAQFLLTIHKGDEEHHHHHQQQKEAFPRPSSDNDDDDSIDLVDADAVDRLAKVAHVFREAAAPTPRGDSNTTVTTTNTTTTASTQSTLDPTTVHNNNNNQHKRDVEEGGPGSGNETDTSSSTPATDSLYRAGGTTGGASAFYAFPAAARRAMKAAYETSSEEWNSVSDFFKPKRASFCKTLVYFVLACIPIVGTSAILFYCFDNLPTGYCEPENPLSDACTGATASASWWLLFLGPRQAVTWMLAKAMDILIIDFWILQHPFWVRLLGPRVTLILVQAKGWPFVLFWWAVWDVVLLYGSGEFYEHWFFWQDTVTLITNKNPGGSITSSDEFRNVIIVAFVVSVAVIFKRHSVGLHLGARLFTRYNDRLKEVMREVMLISELAVWARRKRDQRKTFKSRLAFSGKSSTATTKRSAVQQQHHQFQNHTTTSMSSNGAQAPASHSIAEPPKIVNMNKGSNKFSLTPVRRTTNKNHNSHTVSVPPAEFTDYNKFLTPWEEPQGRRKGKAFGAVSGKEIIEFRQALTVVTKSFFFSASFGPVESRDQCMKSAELLFRRLVNLMGDDAMVDDTTSSDDDLEPSINLYNLTSWLYKGCTKASEQQNAADLMDLFLPDHKGRVTLSSFLTGIDAVYRKVRLLESSVENHSHVDKSYEKVINILFYFLMGCIALAIMGLDPLVFILSISTVLVSFAFMIGSAASQQFEGILMVLVRQPYDIGDCIDINGVMTHQSIDGSAPWEVLSIDLATTTARYLPTNEVATFSNGSLARCRIINLHRSPEAIVHVHTRFAVDVPYEKVLKLKAAVEQYVKDRPQEWVEVLLFRTVMIQPQQNYVEYTFVIQHRTIWQDIGTILISKGQVSSFIVEVQRKLGCYYEAPPVGIEVNVMDEAARQSKIDRREHHDATLEELTDLSKHFTKKTQ